METARQDAAGIAEELRPEFDRRGFAVVRGLFAPAEVAAIATAFERLAARALAVGRTVERRGARFVVDEAVGDEPPRIRRIVWCGAVERRLAAVGRDPRLLRVAAELLGSRHLDWLINQAHFKLPGDGVAFPWHQDSSRRRWGTEWRDVNGRGSYVQSVLAVDAVDADNGPLSFIEGSGALGHLNMPDGRLDLVGLDASRAVTPTMLPGDVLFFGPYTIHGSEPNRSDRPRRVLINGYAYPGANSRRYPGAGLGVPLVAGVPSGDASPGC